MHMMDAPATRGAGVRREASLQLLIAHGDASARAAFARIAAHVASRGLDVVESGDGQETLEMLLGASGPELAVVDWDLPGLEGPELCRLVSQFHDARPPYVILLARAGHDLAEGLDAGAGDCVHTPVDGEELRARIAVGRRFAELLAQRDTARVALKAERSPFDEDDEDEPALAGSCTLESVLVVE
jgi:DNA-binding response OmpR family regulator